MGCARVLLLLVAGCISIPEFKGDAGTGTGDGGNDAGSDAPAGITANVIFVTSTARAPYSIMGDLTQADAWCQELADAAVPKLPTNRYVAWLSKLNNSVVDRVRATGARGWVRPDGKPVAATIDALTAGDHWYPPRLTEKGQDLYDADELVVTGTTAQGQAYNTCGDWNSSTELVQRGVPDASSLLWTEISSGSCVSSRIYCLGTDKDVSVSVELPAVGTTRTAFVSAMTVTPSAGRGSFDAICSSEGMAAGLGSSFLAAVPLSSSTIASRVSTDRPWARVDGVVVLSADMTKMFAPITLDAGGSRRATTVIGGAPSFVANGASTCNDWQSSSQMLQQGESIRSFPGAALDTRSSGCSETTNHVYCLQL